MQMKKSESGRSLVEVLAVLAIIALLMLASILGYDFMMKRWRRQETVKEITELAVRYKLHPVKGNDNKIKIQAVYPEAELANATEMKTPDTPAGRVSIQRVEETTSFSVVVNNSLSDSCRSLLLEGNYDAVLAEVGDFDVRNDYIVLGRDFVKNWTKEAGEAVGLKVDREKLIQDLCGKDKVHTAALVFGDRCPT